MALINHTISYKDLDGNPAVVTYQFNLNASEIAELKIAHNDDLPAYLDKMIKSQNGQEVIIGFRSILTKAVGIREGDQLVKSQEIEDRFVQTGAYDAMFLELIGSKDSGAGFINSIMPQEIIDKHAQETHHSDEELLTMSNREFAEIAGTDPKAMSKHLLPIYHERKERARAENAHKKVRPKKHRQAA
jgi:hypothetical protein